ncbi:MAG: hypothetical protein QOI36_2612 [Pseudonocardiales bacterium]|jgi:hypothetical protein|nr:hypothetical protein [Pseudonocardia sp.]MDT7651206.1 hypothetical protein [Pseudonocardiales bacterium]
MRVQRWVLLVVAVVVWAMPSLGGDTAHVAETDAVARAGDDREKDGSDSAQRKPSRDSDGAEAAPEETPPEEQKASAPAPSEKRATAPPALAGDLLAVVRGRGATIEVAGTSELKRAVGAARPGDTIRMAAGSYDPVVITRSGTAAAPITLTGQSDAVITGSGKGYTVHLDGSSYWQLVGFAVSGGGKGIMTDGSTGLLLDSLTVSDTGDEAVHFRGGSSDNTIQRSTIRNTGLNQPEYGEGVYVGSAKSNWKKYSDGRPDLSMNNRVVGNTFKRITAENVDVKEETRGTLIAGNRFDGSAISGENFADSVVDVKGYGGTVTGNLTTGNAPALKNIIETHVITEPETSGCGNRIENNRVEGFRPAGALVAVDKKCG